MAVRRNFFPYSYFRIYPIYLLSCFLVFGSSVSCANFEMSFNTFHVFLDGVRATALYSPQSSASSLSASFCSLHKYRSLNGKVQLGISVETSVDPFFCFLDCSVSSDLSCDIVLGRDWFTYVSHVIRNATITLWLSETEYLDFGISPQLGIGVRMIEPGTSFLALAFDGTYLSLVGTRSIGLWQ